MRSGRRTVDLLMSTAELQSGAFIVLRAAHRLMHQPLLDAAKRVSSGRSDVTDLEAAVDALCFVSELLDDVERVEEGVMYPRLRRWAPSRELEKQSFENRRLRDHFEHSLIDLMIELRRIIPATPARKKRDEVGLQKAAVSVLSAYREWVTFEEHHLDTIDLLLGAFGQSQLGAVLGLAWGAPATPPLPEEES